MVKFNQVYLQCASSNEAAKFQVTGKEFVSRDLGTQHPYAMVIAPALAGTYRQQSCEIHVADLQE